MGFPGEGRQTRVGCRQRQFSAFSLAMFGNFRVKATHQRYRRTDGRTDRQHYNSSSALCAFVHRALKSYERILIRFQGIRRDPSSNRLDFDDDLDQDPDRVPVVLEPSSEPPEMFKVFFIHSCDSYKRPRIKREILGGGLNSVNAF